MSTADHLFCGLMHRGHSLKQLLRICSASSTRVNFTQELAARNFKSVGSSVPTLLSKQPSSPNLATDVWKPVAFGIFGTGTAFAVAAHFDEQQRKQKTYLIDSVRISESDRRFISYFPAGVARDSAISALASWKTLLPHSQTLFGITGINLCVLAAWRVPRLQNFMVKNFLHTFPPLQTRAYTLLTSAFSHKTIPHFLFNSIALVSFGAEVHRQLGSNQFWAFFTGGALASSVASHLARARSVTGGASLGSSGAVYAVFAMMAYLKPHAEAYFIFLPGVPITLEKLLPGLMALDAAGIVFRWRFFDHWGHLGGAVFGCLYARYGEQYIWANRSKLLPPSDSS